MATLVEYYNDTQNFITFNYNKDIIFNIMDYITNKLVDETYTNVVNKNINDITDNGKYLMINNDTVTFIDKQDIVNIIYKWNIVNNTKPLTLYPKCNNINKQSKINIIGKRGSGKTTLLKNILNFFDDEFIGNSVVFGINSDYHMDSYSDYNIRYLKNFTNDDIDNYLKSNNDCMIIFDDSIISSKKNKNILSKCLQSNKMVIVTYQFCMLSVISDLYSHIFYANDVMNMNINKIHESFTKNNNLMYGDFKSVFKHITKNYGFMVKQNDNICYYQPIYIK